jgi:hypothetical protein
MATVKAVHALHAGGRTYEPGEQVEIADEAEAARLVERGAASWPDEAAAKQDVAPTSDAVEPEPETKKAAKGKR